ncbi:MAG: DNA helicase RecQ [Rhodospirillaceae bacterium]|nr:DNA helicase RecQ [Rhodospirillaceae bacterium]MBT5297439.1 DNA helicase RecQ [Rhodospirillaceae bacterium]MBT5514853.1 DNA helicase RecQ [Rhodospirillaceae bacterium]MBT6086685.1 DNA helicase RecQ [Rhodospirillaceae bacterium]MBT6606873.1 DNA helicase RecQ [Rhodospirillaceae bacterium]
MSLIENARDILRETFGFDDFRPGQEEIITALTAGEHALAVMPTGSGKSLCFQVPALLADGVSIVVSPLVALMEDQVAALRLSGVAAETINSSRSYEDNAESWRRFAAGTAKIMYMAPERLMTERMLTALSKLPLRLIAIDEAHCISRWGPAFRPEYEQLSTLKDRFPGVPIGAMTATADDATRRDIRAQLFNGTGLEFVSGFDRPNINLGVEMRRDGRRQLLSFIEGHADASGIVYCLSRKKTDETAAFLNEKGVRALPYHAGMEKSQRSTNQDIFMTEPGVVMVATIAFGMGIDKPDVRFVFHANLPGNMEAYYQEIGRAGRDGAPAEALMLYGLDDLRMRRMFIDQEDADADHKRREHKRLDTLIAYCETPECRRQALLSYFGEDISPCGNCDVCLDPPKLEDGTTVGQIVLSAVRDTGQMFGAAHLIDVVRGADTEKIRKSNHQRHASYGVGKDQPKEAWRSIIRQLTASGFLQLDMKGYGGLSITEKGAGLLAGAEEFRYRLDAVAKPSTGRSAKKPPPAAVDLSDSDSELFNALKALRLELARGRGVPPYVIFPDKTLADMARKKPASVEAFSEVHGVGQAKLKKFAEPFLGAIASHQGWAE